MTRTRAALTTLALSGLLALSACGAAPQAVPAPAVDVADEAQALTAVGLATEVSPAPSASAPKEKKGRAGLRKHLRKNTLHGEITVQGKDGVKTIVVQRGTVTAVDASTVSVKSTDGFTLSWTLGEKLRVVQDKKKVEATAIKAGAEIGIAGAKEGDKNVARLVRIK